jgi:hypothetical protein
MVVLEKWRVKKEWRGKFCSWGEGVKNMKTGQSGFARIDKNTLK